MNYLAPISKNIKLSPFLVFQQGGQDGFKHFFQIHYKPLLHFAKSLLGDAEAAEDIVEDSFLKLWEHREAIVSITAIKPYLYATVRNACIDSIRRQRHKNVYKTTIQKLPLPIAESIIHKIIISESMHHVYLAVENLPSKYKQIFHMIWVQGKEIKDIAIELNLPLSTVKSQKARAMELIRKQLSHLGSIILLFVYCVF